MIVSIKRAISHGKMKARLHYSPNKWKVSWWDNQLLYWKFCLKTDKHWLVANGVSSVKRTFNSLKDERVVIIFIDVVKELYILTVTEVLFKVLSQLLKWKCYWGEKALSKICQLSVNTLAGHRMLQDAKRRQESAAPDEVGEHPIPAASQLHLGVSQRIPAGPALTNNPFSPSVAWNTGTQTASNEWFCTLLLLGLVFKYMIT